MCWNMDGIYSYYIEWKKLEIKENRLFDFIYKMFKIDKIVDRI